MRQSSNGNHLAVPAAGSSKGDQYQREAERIVAEEREASEKMPYYEGLSERFQLIKKMGDGAFSNVYKARDRQTGQKVAIKVVRKYELNSNQVGAPLHFRFRLPLVCRAFSCFLAPFPFVVPSFRCGVSWSLAIRSGSLLHERRAWAISPVSHPLLLRSNCRSERLWPRCF